ncbi:MAG: lipoprotein-releasing ABC transporter permease subunit [Acidiferrobacteraceae bacterium]|jgi:lipoprotein-releasing system permease protein
MIRPLEVFIGLRYTRARRRSQFISFISLMSSLGIVLGVAALIVVLSVMNGFGKELRARIVGVVSHITITEEPFGLRNWRAVADRIAHKPHVVASAPYIDGRGLVLHGQTAKGVFVRGIVPQREELVSSIGKHMRSGALASLQPDAHKLVLGLALAKQLDVHTGDHLALIVPANGKGDGAPRLQRFTVSGIFSLGMYEYDSSLVLVNLADASKLFGKPSYVSGLRIRVDRPDLAPAISRDLGEELGDTAYARDWTQRHRNFFIALQDQKRILFLVLTLIVAVAAFNIVSTMVMLVTDKRADIAILRTLGMKPTGIMAVFVVQGSTLATAGTVLGVLSGVVLAWNVESIVHWIERTFGFHFLAADIYPITDLPASIHWPDVWSIAGISIALGVVATIYPAWRAARIQPAEALRYE